MKFFTLTLISVLLVSNSAIARTSIITDKNTQQETDNPPINASNKPKKTEQESENNNSKNKRGAREGGNKKSKPRGAR